MRLGHEVRVLSKVPTSYIPEEEARSFETREELNGVQIIRVKALGSSVAIAARMLDQLWVATQVCVRTLCIKHLDVIIVYSPPSTHDCGCRAAVAQADSLCAASA